MKAREYFEKYYVAAEEEFDIARVPTILKDFSTEAKEICEKRHVSQDRSVISVLKEQNTKWNALVEIFKKKTGKSPILKDGFKRYWLMKLPDTVNMW